MELDLAEYLNRLTGEVILLGVDRVVDLHSDPGSCPSCVPGPPAPLAATVALACRSEAISSAIVTTNCSQMTAPPGT